jgi:hypothetical protein
MKTRIIVPLLAFVCVLGGALGWTARAQKRGANPPLATSTQPPAAAPARTTWEYKIVSESQKVAMNELGAEGWELVAVTNGGAEEVYFFKRAK